MRKEVRQNVRFVIIDGKVYEVKKDKSGKRYIELPDPEKEAKKKG